ncbi:MAG: hydroxyacid dehydrogenase, partial [Candidatus Gerdarchaeota archaeon]
SEKDLKIFPSNYPLHEFDNVVLSPHRAGHVAEGYERAHWQDVIENILRIYQGLEPENLIDIEKGY